ncbi:MAG: tryptophan synthase subunit alpha [Termitinemataceae bacterium]|nr:MAG: tryptophan synthase subunit alpha [Termitinemataceae bacterium]
MNNNISKAFQNGKAFIGFVTGGDPSCSKTVEFILQMEKAGADIVEIGIPFSDPIAEGQVIQEANIRALNAGANVEKMFDIVKDVRKVSKIPLVFLTYFNPVFRYGNAGDSESCGTEAFLKKSCECGLDGIIIPDLPYEESFDVKNIAAKHGIDLISLIAPTSEQRISEIAKNANGFIYVVSSMGVTGVRSNIQTDLASILKTIKASSTVPAAIGFGINTVQQAKDFSKIADGIIVGSAIVKIVASHGENAAPHIYEYVKSMKDAVR